ncbi:MAG: response regulator transcription factor [Actinobacteria bacterium]|nr:response regulator transcription factor [Actinomycetota bacterium]
MAQELINVLVVDDHPIVREGTRQILEGSGNIRVVAEAATAQEAFTQIEEHHPDIVLLDVRLPGTNGIEAAKRIVSDYPDTQIIILSAYGDPDYVRAALGAGVYGYLLKTAPDDELICAIRSVHSGSLVLDSTLAGNFNNAQAGFNQARGTPELTDRELEIVSMVAQGMPNKQIAAKLEISRRTVEGHVRHIFDKLAVNSRTQLSVYAIEHRLVPGGSVE